MLLLILLYTDCFNVLTYTSVVGASIVTKETEDEDEMLAEVAQSCQQLLQKNSTMISETEDVQLLTRLILMHERLFNLVNSVDSSHLARASRKEPLSPHSTSLQEKERELIEGHGGKDNFEIFKQSKTYNNL